MVGRQPFYLKSGLGGGATAAAEEPAELSGMVLQLSVGFFPKSAGSPAEVPMPDPVGREHSSRIGPGNHWTEGGNCNCQGFPAWQSKHGDLLKSGYFASSRLFLHGPPAS